MVKKLLVLTVLFCAVTTSFGEYKLQTKLIDSDPVTKGYFGYSVDIDGNNAIVKNIKKGTATIGAIPFKS